MTRSLAMSTSQDVLPSKPSLPLFAIAWILSAWFATPALATPSLGEREFRLGKDGSELLVFTLTEPGTLVLRARVREPIRSAPLLLRLEGPNGLRVEKKGSAPLRLRYAVANAASETWRASVINVGKLPNVTGKLTIDLQPSEVSPPNRSSSGPPASESESSSASSQAPPSSITDGKITYVDSQRLRAVCRDRNPDVAVHLDLETDTGELRLRFNPVFALEVRQTSDERFELRGSGPHPLILDLGQKTLRFDSGEPGVFCRVRVYRDGSE